MADEVPTGDRAVFAFFEMVALAFAFEGVAALLNRKPWPIVTGSWLASAVFFLIGVKWPSLKKRLSGSVYLKLKEFSVNPLFWLVAGAIAGALLLSGVNPLVERFRLRQAAVKQHQVINPSSQVSETPRKADVPRTEITNDAKSANRDAPVKPKSSKAIPPTSSAPVSAPFTVITVQDSSTSPVVGAQVLLVSSNGTHSEIEITNAKGTVRVARPVSLSVDVYCGHKNFLAYYKSGNDPSDPLLITLQTETGFGSLVHTGVGFVHFPGLNGTWDPRTYPSSYPNAGEHYAYPKNISVNGHIDALVPFIVGQDLLLEDNQGHRIDLRLIAANLECFLMQYRRR